MPRPPTPDARARLLNAARAEFARVGVDEARVADVSRAAGFSKGTFYLHFPSKEQCFAELVASFFSVMQAGADERHTRYEAMVADWGPCTAQDWSTASERWIAFAELDHAYNLRSLEELWEWRDLLGCVLDQLLGARGGLADNLAELTRQTLASRLQQSADIGSIHPDFDPELASEMIVGIYLQLGRRMTRLAEKPDLARWARDIDRFVSSGLRPDEPVRARGQRRARGGVG